eukprot:UN01346
MLNLWKPMIKLMKKWIPMEVKNLLIKMIHRTMMSQTKKKQQLLVEHLILLLVGNNVQKKSNKHR